MSYDIDLRDVPCPTCQHAKSAHFDMSPTYNLTPLFDFALTGETLPNPEVSEARVVLLRAETARPRGLRLLHGKTGEETLPALVQAFERLNDPELHAQITPLLPANGWGTLDGALKTIEAMLDAAKWNPTYIWDIR